MNTKRPTRLDERQWMRKATALVVLASVGSTLLALQAGLTWPGWTLLIIASWMGSVMTMFSWLFLRHTALFPGARGLKGVPQGALPKALGYFVSQRR